MVFTLRSTLSHDLDNQLTTTDFDALFDWFIIRPHQTKMPPQWQFLVWDDLDETTALDLMLHTQDIYDLLNVMKTLRTSAFTKGCDVTLSQLSES